MEKIDISEDYKIEKLKNSKKMACDGWNYSLQRMDLLIISISSAGVYIVLETIKFSFDKSHALNNPATLKISGIFFVLSIIINFLSQLTGQSANTHHINWVDEQLLSDKPPTQIQLQKIDNCNSTASKWHTFTSRLNVASMVLLFIGLILIMVYFLFLI